MQDEYKYHMDQCLEIAKTALIAGNLPIGAIVVYDGKVIGTGQGFSKTLNKI